MQRPVGAALARRPRWSGPLHSASLVYRSPSGLPQAALPARGRGSGPVWAPAGAIVAAYERPGDGSCTSSMWAAGARAVAAAAVAAALLLEQQPAQAADLAAVSGLSGSSSVQRLPRVPLPGLQLGSSPGAQLASRSGALPPLLALNAPSLSRGGGGGGAGDGGELETLDNVPGSLGAVEEDGSVRLGRIFKGAAAAAACWGSRRAAAAEQLRPRARHSDDDRQH